MKKLTKKIGKKSGIAAVMSKSEIPMAVYAAVLVALLTIGLINIYNPDLSLNLFSELLGAAFTLFVIDVLLVRTKTKRWRIVSDNIDYLISRDINRIRDGLATRAFSFDPAIDFDKSREEQLETLRADRANFLNELEHEELGDISARLVNSEFFSDDNQDYFVEKADDIWNLLNMKYSEYLDPALVAELIELHTLLRDVCAHIRQYHKSNLFPGDGEYYRDISLKGAAVGIKKILGCLNRLKAGGYSISARMDE